MVIQINIGNKTAYVLIGILALILVAGAVYAFTTDGSGNPVVMGHSADEIAGIGFGDYSPVGNSNIYQAETDGFVIAYSVSTTAGLYGYLGSTSSSLGMIAISKGSVAVDNHIMFPVKKGDYWKIEGAQAQTAWWVSVGS